MCVLRIKINYGYYLVDKNRTYKNKTIRCNTVPCLVDGEIQTYEFGGVANIARAAQLQNVWLLDVESYSLTGDLFDMHSNKCKLLGVIYGNAVYLCVNQNGIVCYL